MNLPKGIEATRRATLRSARQTRDLCWQLFCAAYRTKGIDKEEANAIHQDAVALEARIAALGKAKKARKVAA